MKRADAGLGSGQDSRICDMEIRLSYQDRMLSDLDEVVRGFALRVERLERQLDEVKSSMATPEMGSGDEKPPHY